MIKKMLINAMDPEELRVALVEDGRLEAFYVETAAKEQTRGNIYKGVVVNVEPSLQAAFVDYGMPRHGFLQITDVNPEIYPAGKATDKGLPSIQEVLRKGQEILVQVVKEETATKGAALTTYFSIPGQSLVLTPGRDHHGVSRKIESDTERNRLKEILEELKLAPSLGIISRTASEGRSKRDLLANARLLLRLWEDIQKRGKEAKAPALIHREEELAVRTVRDLFTSEVSEVLVDDSEVFARLEEFVGLVNPRRKKALKLYRDKRPIFSKYDIEQQLESVYQPTVPLRCGGSIVISPTEALVAVDVNSGKAIKGKEIEETALTVNLEAAGEIARQLRLRDLGGLIVIDFIDMRDRKHQNEVQKQLKDELKKDKAKVTVGRISRFGLLELSRQRIRPPIDFGSTRACPHCQGRGLVRTTEALGRMVLRNLARKLGRNEPGWRLRLNPELAHWLVNAKRADLADLEARAGTSLEVVAAPGLGPEDQHLERVDLAWAPVPAEAPRSERPAPARPAECETRPAKPAPPKPAPAKPAPVKEPSPPIGELVAEGGPEDLKAPAKKRRSRRRKPKAAPGAAPAAEAADGTAAALAPVPAPESEDRAAAPAPAPELDPGPEAGEPGQGPEPDEAGEAGEAGEAAARKRRGRRRSGSARRRAKKLAAQRQNEAPEGAPDEAPDEAPED
ncbi:MAG: Rne/Rng family ribonuclease [Pseudomonadota bacterium]